MTDKKLSNVPELPFSSYKFGRFEYLQKESFTIELWEYLRAKKNVQSMIGAIEDGKPALWPLLDYIETHFAACITSDQFATDDVQVMINNMIKQIMEFAGYEHIACGMLPQAKYIKISGVYRKNFK